MTHQVIKEQILQEIIHANTIIIHRHVRPDPDAIGSQKGLAEIIKASFPEKTVYTAGETTESLTDLLGAMNPPTAEDYQQALVIVTDTANTARLDGLEQIPAIDQAIKIDHHPNDEPYGKLAWVDTDASSCSEMIVEFWQTYKDQLTLTDQAAQWLYTGIVGDTNRFLYPSTSSKTMHLAGDLLDFDFDHAAVNHQMNTITPATAKLMSYILAHLTIAGGVGSIIFDQTLLDELGVTDEDTSKIVALPGNIEGVQAWGIFVQQPDAHYRARLRSKGPVINDIARRHGGGGHPLACGANAADHEEISQIIAELTDATRLFQDKK